MQIIIDFLSLGFQVLEGYVHLLCEIIFRIAPKTTIERKNICKKCEHNKHGICKLCGCVIPAKIRVRYPLDENGKSIDGCPLKKW